MEPTLSNNEQSMREKILQQEFPFDPKAWEAMQGLLDDQDRTPPPPPSAPPSGPQPGPGTAGRLKWILLLLLLAVGAGSTTLILKNMEPRKYSVESPAANRHGVSGTGGKDGRSAVALRNNSINTETVDLTTATGTVQKTGRTASDAAVKDSPAIPSGKAASGAPVRKNKTTGKEAAGDFTMRRPPSGQQQLPLAAAGQQEQELAAAITPADNMAEAAANLPAGNAPGLALLPFLPVELLPGIPTDTLAVPQRPDSIIRPVPYQPISESRRERGWIVGANLNTVDYRPLRFSVLPHLGYFWRYRLQPRTTVQGELVLKFVSGYDWRAEFFDMVPGGSTQVILENKRLLYIEVPFVLQRAYAPGQSWQIGLKPALTLPIAPYGSYSSANFGAPRRDYPAHEGIRYLDMGLVLGWEYRFNRRWALDIRYNQGLFDLTVDNFYRQRETHLNSDMQVSLRHFITKKTKKHEPKTLFPAPPAGR